VLVLHDALVHPSVVPRALRRGPVEQPPGVGILGDIRPFAEFFLVIHGRKGAHVEEVIGSGVVDAMAGELERGARLVSGQPTQSQGPVSELLSTKPLLDLTAVTQGGYSLRA
jgi:hypothetical protein